MTCKQLTVDEYRQLIEQKPNAKGYKSAGECECTGRCCQWIAGGMYTGPGDWAQGNPGLSNPDNWEFYGQFCSAALPGPDPDNDCTTGPLMGGFNGYVVSATFEANKSCLANNKCYSQCCARCADSPTGGNGSGGQIAHSYNCDPRELEQLKESVVCNVEWAVTSNGPCGEEQTCQCDLECTGGIWQSIGCARECLGDYDRTGPCPNEGERQPGFCLYCP
jgi:hypothetical protein